MQVRQFTGMQQERQDAYAQSTKPQTQQQQPASAPNSVDNNGLDHQEIQSHGPIARLPGATSSFDLGNPPKPGSVLGKGVQAI